MDKNEYFSQCGQDKWVIKDILKFKRGGFFLDLAAGDGINISNTYVLEKRYGWNGICIEASDNLFSKLKENRSCICENACIDGKEHTVKFIERNGFSGGIVDSNTDNKVATDYVLKKTTTLKKILQKHNAPRIIDYFSLDVEGAETRIMEGFPFKDYVFSAMTIERPSKLLKFILKREGYIVVGVNPCDKLYIHKSTLPWFTMAFITVKLYVSFYIRKIGNKIHRGYLHFIGKA